ncbi:MAG TPA: metallophosphoesterase [Nitrospirae bacterium]|nr:metallophosphoesterase [Nitrospirota bacterium]
MRYALISDIHANLEAFEAVLKDIKSVGVDNTLFLGDIVGYGPNPNECMDLLLKEADLSLGGNHDWAAVGMTPSEYFNPYAKSAMDWTVEVLRDDLKDFLLRTRAQDTFDGIQVAHSSPLNPEQWQYIMTQKDAVANYPHIQGDICFIGHSHQPIVIECAGPDNIKALRVDAITLSPGMKYLVNIGSVGQPRDSNNHSCWVVYDSDLGSVEFRRVGYDISVTQKKMSDAGLAIYLIDRLSEGR